MSEYSTELFIELSLDGGDRTELDDLTRQLKAEVEELRVDSIAPLSAGAAPAGAKSADLTALGQLAVTLAPTLIPPLFDLMKSWVERKPSTPVKIKVRVGKRTAQVEYDPTRTSAQDLETLVRTLGRTLKA